MKRIIAIFLLICFICTIITGCKKDAISGISGTSDTSETSSTVSKNPNDLMLFPFEDGEGNEKLYNGSFLSMDLSFAPWNQSFVKPLCTLSHTDTGMGLKMPLNNAKDAWYQTLSASTPKEFKVNEKNYRYLRVWVSNVGEGTLALNVLLSAGMYYYNFLNADKSVVTSSNGTLLNVKKLFTMDKFIPEAVNHGFDSVVLPAGFSGWVAFPLSEKTVNYLGSAPINKLSDATTIDLNILTESQKTAYYVIDDICLTNQESGVSK